MNSDLATLGDAEPVVIVDDQDFAALFRSLMMPAPAWLVPGGLGFVVSVTIPASCVRAGWVDGPASADRVRRDTGYRVLTFDGRGLPTRGLCCGSRCHSAAIHN